jgi:uncharacterized membrane protein
LNFNNNERNGVLLNGALIAMGLASVLDNVFSHWLFKWHRILPNHRLSTYLEIVLFIAGLIMLTIGIYREIKGRQSR